MLVAPLARDRGIQLEHIHLARQVTVFLLRGGFGGFIWGAGSSRCDSTLAKASPLPSISVSISSRLVCVVSVYMANYAHPLYRDFQLKQERIFLPFCIPTFEI